MRDKKNKSEYPSLDKFYKRNFKHIGVQLHREKDAHIIKALGSKPLKVLRELFKTVQ